MLAKAYLQKVLFMFVSKLYLKATSQFDHIHLYINLLQNMQCDYI